MAEIFVSVGSNINPEAHIRAALIELRKTFSRVRVSPVYRSQAVGFEGEDFLNLVVAAETDLAPTAVVETLQHIENRFGRDRSQPKFSSRSLDLDLLLYDDVVSAAGGVQLPRDEIPRYGFVLAPLADIAGLRRHPVTGETFGQMWSHFVETGNSRLQKIAFDWGEI